MKKADIVTLDVREDILQGREPFSRIMRTVDGLKQRQKLLLVAPFEPLPLYEVLGRQGFGHTSKTIATGDFEVLFSRKNDDSEPEVIEVDARGLGPPRPLVMILKAASELPADAELRALTDHRPLLLYPPLKARGFTSKTTKNKDGSYVTRIRHK